MRGENAFVLDAAVGAEADVMLAPLVLVQIAAHRVLVAADGALELWRLVITRAMQIQTVLGAVGERAAGHVAHKLLLFGVPQHVVLQLLEGGKRFLAVFFCAQVHLQRVVAAAAVLAVHVLSTVHISE